MFKALKKVILERKEAKKDLKDSKVFLLQEEELLKILEDLDQAFKEGKSANHTIETIANKHKVDIEVIEDQIIKGIEIEKEHTEDETLAKKIAMDHLVEFPDYYDRLEKMEKAAKLKEDIYWQAYQTITIEESVVPVEEREFGVPNKKKFPLYDKKHVLAAIKFFNWVDSEDESKLARAIIMKMKVHGLRKSNVGEDNKLKKYVERSKLPE